MERTQMFVIAISAAIAAKVPAVPRQSKLTP
jgi:hypothetical protein